jgi:hypothetical protein
MIVDSEEQRKLLLEVMDQVSYPGRALEMAYALRQAVIGAAVHGEDANADMPRPRLGAGGRDAA